MGDRGFINFSDVPVPGSSETNPLKLPDAPALRIPPPHARSLPPLPPGVAHSIPSTAPPDHVLVQKQIEAGATLDTSYDARIWRAASVSLSSPRINSYGEASLIEHPRDTGRYGILTVQHVAEQLAADPDNAYMFIPGIGSDDKGPESTRFKLTPSRFWRLNSNADEAPVVYPLNEAATARVKAAIDANMLQPLYLAEYHQPAGTMVAVANPQMGGFTRLTIGEYDFHRNQVTLVNQGLSATDSVRTNGDICEGRSGGAVLKVDQGTVLPYIMGVVRELHPQMVFRLPDDRLGRICSPESRATTLIAGDMD